MWNSKPSFQFQLRLFTLHLCRKAEVVLGFYISFLLPQKCSKTQNLFLLRSLWAILLIQAPLGGLTQDHSHTCSQLLTRAGLGLLHGSQAELQELQQSTWLLEAWAGSRCTVTSTSWMDTANHPASPESRERQSPPCAGRSCSYMAGV